jgi:hypothetical protein
MPRSVGSSGHPEGPSALPRRRLAQHPLAERAVDSGDPSALADFLATAVRDETSRRFTAMQAARVDADRDGVEARRAYVQAMLGLQVWAHKLHAAVHAAAHEGAHHDHR